MTESTDTLQNRKTSNLEYIFTFEESSCQWGLLREDSQAEATRDRQAVADTLHIFRPK